MKIIAHRINTLKQLDELPPHCGIEVDIRYHNDSLILHHDPFSHHKEPFPCLFEELLKCWHSDGIMILNIKTEGIEDVCIELMKKYSVKAWFFLDISMPYIVKYADCAYKGSISGFSPENLAVRFSEFEPVEYALAFKNKAKWVWVDCFTHLPLDIKTYKLLKEAGYKICIVAPELQKHPAEDADIFLQQINGMEIDAVCTKRIDLWET